MIQTCFKLPVQFDPERLQEDYQRLQRSFNTYNRMNLGANWEGIPLVSVEGKTGEDGLWMGDRYEPTPLLKECTYIPEVIKALQCEGSARVRILGLKAGGVIPTHTDRHSSFYLGVVCLHIPIVTHPDVWLMSKGKRYHMAPGELWYLDNSFPHSVYNESTIYRAHILIDCCPMNNYLLSLFPKDMKYYYLFRHLYVKARYYSKLWRIKKLVRGA